MNFQQSRGEFSPNVNGNNNQTNHNSANIKLSLGSKARYTLFGFLIGIATSYIGSYLYDNYKIEKTTNIQSEQIVTNNTIQGDSI